MTIYCIALSRNFCCAFVFPSWKPGWTLKGRIHKRKTFSKEKKLYTTFSKSFSYPPSDVLNILWCKFSTGSPIHITHTHVNIHIRVYYMYILTCVNCICVCMCARLYIYIYMWQAAGFFSIPFFFLFTREIAQSEREGGNKNKRNKKKK